MESTIDTDVVATVRFRRPRHSTSARNLVKRLLEEEHTRTYFGLPGQQVITLELPYSEEAVIQARSWVRDMEIIITAYGGY